MTHKIPLEVISIENDGFHLIVSVTVNGLSANLLVDTGASKTVFDEERLSKLMNKDEFVSNDKLSTGLGTNSMESKLAIIQKLDFGGLAINSFEVAVLNLQHVNESYEKLEIAPIDGVMGGDLLVRLQAIVDYSQKKLFITV